MLTAHYSLRTTYLGNIALGEESDDSLDKTAEHLTIDTHAGGLVVVATVVLVLLVVVVPPLTASGGGNSDGTSSSATTAYGLLLTTK